jgi:hypothetical protein
MRNSPLNQCHLAHLPDLCRTVRGDYVRWRKHPPITRYQESNALFINSQERRTNSLLNVLSTGKDGFMRKHSKGEGKMRKVQTFELIIDRARSIIGPVASALLAGSVRPVQFGGTSMSKPPSRRWRSLLTGRVQKQISDWPFFSLGGVPEPGTRSWARELERRGGFPFLVGRGWVYDGISYLPRF